MIGTEEARMAEPDPDAPARAGPTGLVYDIATVPDPDGRAVALHVCFKGCPLNCTWCPKPEARRHAPELGFRVSDCRLSAECTAVCPVGAHSFDDDGHVIEWELCEACGDCVKVCAEHALFLIGRRVSVEEVVAEARALGERLSAVVLTGGEPTEQAAFCTHLLAACRRAGLATVLETNGCGPWERLASLMPLCDAVVFDLKLMDDEEHRLLVGQSNHFILENLERLGALAARDGLAVSVRVPLIPGITDTDENLNRIYALAIQVGVLTVRLQPYVESPIYRYTQIGRRYALKLPPQTPEELAELAAYAELLGLEVTVV
jgi:pyruvate formate lyase activating enzyme